MGSEVGELQITYTIYSQDSCLKNCPLAVDVKYLALSNTQQDCLQPLYRKIPKISPSKYKPPKPVT